MNIKQNEKPTCIYRIKTSVPSWGSVRMLHGRADAQKSTSPTASSHRGEASDTGAAGHDLRDDENSLEEDMSWMDVSPKMPFRFMQYS